MNRLIPGYALLAASLVGATMASTTVASAEDFYAGKRITFLISSSPGGGNDLRARMLARHIGKHIPGNPSTVSQNMTGGSYLIANNHINNVAPQDGLTILQTLRAIYWPQLMGVKDARFDLTKVHWLGSTSPENSALVVRSSLGPKTFKEFKALDKPIVMACTGPNSTNYILGQVLKVALDVKLKMVCGYKSTGRIKLAMGRGEADGLAGRSLSNILGGDSQLVKNGEWNVLMQFGAKRHPAFPDLPTAYDMAENDEARSIIKTATADAGIGWPLYVAAGVPADRVKILRTAFLDTMKDPAFLADAKKAKYTIDPIPGEELDQVVKEALSADKKLMPKLREIYFGPEAMRKK